MPTAEGSLAVSLTDQVTLEVGIPPDIAENCTVSPAATTAELGVIVIIVEGAIEFCPPHPSLNVASASANTITANCRCNFATSTSVFKRGLL
jgi:hypothetical protein